MNERSYLFDNLKFLLIYFVVIGHWVNIVSAYLFIYSFHIPLFVFISGYFSKRDQPIKRLVAQLLLPYVVLTFLWFLYKRALNQPDELLFWLPPWALWYLISLFLWRLLIRVFSQTKFLVAISFIVGLLVGFIPQIGEEFSLSRTIALFPFFVLGYKANEEHIRKIRSKRNLFIPIGIACLALFIFLYHFESNPISRVHLLWDGSYSNAGTPFSGVFIRLILYIVGVLVSLAVIGLAPTNKTPFSYIGQQTLYVFVFHVYFLEFFRRKILPHYTINHYVLFVVIAIISFIIVLLLSTKFVERLYKFIMSPIRVLLKETH